MTAQTYQEILVERAQQDVLTVRLNRPDKRNALSRAALTEIGHAFESHADDQDIKVAILTAVGDRAFAAGGDLKELESVRTELDPEVLFSLGKASLDAIRCFPVPTVAALNGTAVGGGAELAVASDFRLAMPHVTIGFVQARLAITSGFGGGADLMKLLGVGPALLHMLRAETLNAEEAHSLGLIDEVARPNEDLGECVERFIAPIRMHPVQVVRALKAQALAARSGVAAEERERLEREGFARTWSHPDHWAAHDRVLSRKGGP